HRRPELRWQDPAVRQADRQAAVGGGAALFRECDTGNVRGERPSVPRDRRGRRQGTSRRTLRRHLRCVRPAGGVGAVADRAAPHRAAGDADGTILISKSFGQSLPVTNNRSPAASYAIPFSTSTPTASRGSSRPSKLIQPVT